MDGDGGHGMSALVSSKEVEAVLRSLLETQGYRVSAERGYGETGTDIVAEKGTEVLHIEAIAFKSSPPARSKDFYEAFFRAVSRIQLNATGPHGRLMLTVPGGLAEFERVAHEPVKA